MPTKPTRPWDKKKRTALRSIQPGDLFLFGLDAGGYGLGRILSTVSLGHVVEFFAPILPEPDLAGMDIDALSRHGQPLIIDSYSLFDRKLEGDWRIVGSEAGFVPRQVEGLYFVYGDVTHLRKVDIHDQESPVDAASAAKLPPYSPNGHAQVQLKLYADR